jgi:uncharacterized protein YjeT (DUF2065 family)
MELSIFLAKAWGLLLLLVGLGGLIDRKYYQEIIKNFTKLPWEMLATGWVALAAGLAMITYHNIWQGEWWVILITLFGWVTFVRGVFRLLIPRLIMRWTGVFLKSCTALSVSWVLCVALGGVLTYYGFFV